MGLLSSGNRAVPADSASGADVIAFPHAARPAPYNAQFGLTASAATFSLTQRRDTDALRQHQSVAFPWQERAWRCAKRIGEVGFAFELMATYLSRCRIHAAVVANPDEPPIEVGSATMVRDSKGEIHGTTGGVDPQLAVRARALVEQFSADGLVDMLKLYAMNVQIPGECYLVRIDDKWCIKSTSELRISSDGTARLYPSAAQQSNPRILPKTTPIGRIWQKDARYSFDATSSLVPVLDDGDELILLSQMVRNVTKSRLNAGILFIPDGFSVASQTTSDEALAPGEEVDETDDGFEAELMALVTDPLANENSASAAIPMLVRGPADQGNQIKLIQISRDVDEHLITERANVLDRVLNGINAPKDVVGGVKGLKYANAKMVDEQTYKAHVEPLALLFVIAVTEIFLRPLLLADAEANGWDPDQVRRIVVWYDPSEITTRPDRGADADAGHDRNVLSDATWRQAHGFGDTDAPGETELAQRMLLKNPPPPDVLNALFHLVFGDTLALANAKLEGEGQLPSRLSQMLSGSQTIGADAPTQSSDPAAPAPATPASSAAPDPTDSSLGTPES